MVSPLGVAFAVGAAVCLAGQALTVRLATRNATSNEVLMIILLFNAGVLLPIAAVVPDSHGLTPTAVVAFAAAGIASTMLGRMFFYGGIERIGAARAEPLKASMPLHATVLAVVLLNESVSVPQFLGVVLIVGGIALVSWDGAARDAAVTGSIDWTGLALPLVGAFLFALEPILANVGLAEGTPVTVGLAVKTVAASAVFGTYLGLRGELPARETVAVDGRWVVAAGIANTAFLLAYYAGLSVARVSVVVPIMQTSPLLVAGASVLFLRGVERVTVPLVAGSSIVVAGAIAVTLFG